VSNPVTLTKKVSEDRFYAVSFANSPERLAGQTLSNPELIPSTPNGPTFSQVVVNTTAFSGIDIGSAVVFFASGGDIGDVCDFAVRVTASGGSKPVVSCRLIVTKDYGLIESETTVPVVGFTPEQLLEFASNPLVMKNADQEVQERSMDELIALDKYLKAKQAAENAGSGNPFGGLKFGLIRPPGTTGRQ